MTPHDPNRTPNRTPNRRSEADSHERTNERTNGDYPDGRLSGTGSRRTGAYENDSSIPPSVNAVLDDYLNDLEHSVGERWAVHRRGEREPIPWLLRLSIYRRDGFTCKLCGFNAHDDLSILNLDHCKPWSAGGSDDSTNLRALCAGCNTRRSNFYDYAHLTRYLPTTWWCADCWSPNSPWRPLWSDHTDLNAVDRVSEDASIRAYCAWCQDFATTDRVFTGEPGRALIMSATKWVSA